MVNLLKGLAAEWHPTKNGTLSFDELTSGSAKKVWWLGLCGHEWEAVFKSRVNGKKCPICSNRSVLVGFNDLGTTNPQIAAEWHPTKNGALLASDFTAGSNHRAWWLGLCGHEWDVEIKLRKAHGCPFCSGKRILSGFNDLGTTNPQIAGEWHPTKNNQISPSAISAGTHEKYWWVCSKNPSHIWQASPKLRMAGTGCPTCSNKKVQKGYNDFATLNPLLAKQWHPTKNENINSNEVTSSSGKKVWWLGECGHEWEHTIQQRTNGSGCPICINQKVVPGFNDLMTTAPELAEFWHPTKNSFSPEDITKGSNRVIWWLGACGHEWETTLSHYQRSSACPYCVGRRVLVGFNDLATTHPRLVEEWGELNQRIPQNVTHGSKNKINWVCVKQHEWAATICDRTLKLSNCPHCAARTFVSRAEHELFTYLTGLGLIVEQSNRKVLGRNREIDLWLPEQKVGVEFNGVYWHSDKFLDKNYHHEKFLAAKKVGIQLIQVWEDDWNSRKSVIESTLAHKLGVGQRARVFARKTVVDSLTTAVAKDFLNSYHIQGFASGSYYLGLKDAAGSVVAVLVLKKEPGNTLNIVRYATSVQVVGGFTKLLSYAEKVHSPDRFITFADHMISDGGLYENNGFVADKVLAPDYMYVVRGVRKHKFGYRLKRFKNDPELLWQEGLTERELAELNGLPRVWDAGKTRWVKACH